MLTQPFVTHVRHTGECVCSTGQRIHRYCASFHKIAFRVQFPLLTLDAGIQFIPFAYLKAVQQISTG